VIRDGRSPKVARAIRAEPFQSRPRESRCRLRLGEGIPQPRLDIALVIDTSRLGDIQRKHPGGNEDGFPYADAGFPSGAAFLRSGSSSNPWPGSSERYAKNRSRQDLKKIDIQASARCRVCQTCDTKVRRLRPISEPQPEAMSITTCPILSRARPHCAPRQGVPAGSARDRERSPSRREPGRDVVDRPALGFVGHRIDQHHVDRRVACHQRIDGNTGSRAPIDA